MTKLSKIIIDNLKNVQHGEMSFKNKHDYLNVVGIYGQNGSGKTTLIDAVGILQTLILGYELDHSITDYLNDDPATLTLVSESEQHAFTYEVTLKKVAQSVRVIGESLSQAKLPNYTYHKTVFSYQVDDTRPQVVIKPEKGNFASLTLPLLASVKGNRSFIFGTVFQEWRQQNKTLKKYHALLTTYRFIRKTAINITIHTEVMNGYLASGNFMPLSFALNQKNGRHAFGTLPIQLDQVSELSQPMFQYSTAKTELIKNVIAKISAVITQIVPGLALKAITRAQTAKDGTTEEFSIELLTIRDGKQIPLRAESLGVQKLVSVLALLIEVYNNPNQIVLIDELDSGIFEFLLGELVKIMSDGAKGQLIFTSHNLRVLETLPDTKIYFSTDDPHNRYLQLEGTRESNNLRNIYLRKIQTNDTQPNLYEKTDSSRIRFAFEDAALTDTDQTKNPYINYTFGL
ncbi:AAA family ATPase [Loigolactobacillus bifermentans]|uniref:Uncharacterized protein n=1 Tax=Loigolactobacillus bifermentans DSM 20003 TaxID=1423726 RepID=A0A0R1GWZ6_9LACO|nr:AAA family ATPase [Loigolactobacillus bifermentans]KRK36036.1 hypothetical protein FC07_GL000083 [Loigolactobacillus bifermentans DSM 20003]QGG61044.1 AAA family ATPase [Loigolactobacillus bifermentans]